MNYTALKVESYHLFHHYPFLSVIHNKKEYQEALVLVEELIDEDDEKNEPLIDLISRSIEKWEDNSEIFSEFNKRQDSIDPAIVALKILMAQHQLKISDFENEIGKKSYVSQILNGKKNLSLKHVRNLSERFNISASIFV